MKSRWRDASGEPLSHGPAAKANHVFLCRKINDLRGLGSVSLTYRSTTPAPPYYTRARMCVCAWVYVPFDRTSNHRPRPRARDAPAMVRPRPHAKQNYMVRAGEE